MNSLLKKNSEYMCTLYMLGEPFRIMVGTLYPLIFNIYMIV